ncbi:MAG: cation-transporting P-type ATPase [Nitrosomonas sp.]|nr:cation-transporting P-type ATPase [Nitrosomonas sp.]
MKQTETTENIWHSHPVEQVLQTVQTKREGLSTQEAEKRLDEHGFNRLPQTEGRTWYARLWAHINNVLIWIMLVSSVIAALLGHGVDAAVIILVITINTIIGYIQEGKAEKALEAIQSMVAPRASVLRDGKRLTLDAERIVPGDLIVLESGDRVPADLRLIHAKSLRIEEAALTGESVPVEKSVTPVNAETPLAEQSCMAFSGTFVSAGQGTGVVIGTGGNTELGRISAMLGNVELLKTPLLRQMDRLAKQLTLIILAVAALLFAAAYGLRGYDLANAFMIVVGFAVAVVPEGLPAVMTITLAIGVNRMAKRNAIIRRLPAVETLGAVSVICSDKTGTLTRNEMTVQAVVTADGQFDVAGVGYEPGGGFGFQRDGKDIPIEHEPVVQELCRAALLCNDAVLNRADNGWYVEGDPMEGALVVLALKAGYEQEALRKQLPRNDEIPFDAEHRFMATLHHDHERGEKYMMLKGAPEQVITMCETERHANGDRPISAEWWLKQIESLASQGERVLALATKSLPHAKNDLIFDDTKTGLTLLGLVGLIDPPREEAIEAVRHCRTAGIRVVMITGDHAVTAQAIARQLGIADDPKTLTGSVLDSLDDAALHRIVKEVTVFARANPEHKLRLVRALQAEGSVIAMTGDGVNDAPALKQADVGVAMGRKGTAVAKEAAEIVLADDNFASIAAAVREGRTVYDNLRKVIAWTLPTNAGEVMAIIVAVMFALPLPITPVQTLWVNMVTSVALGLVLAFEPTEPGTMQRPPRGANAPIIDGFMLWRIIFVATLFMAAAFGMFYYALAQGMPVEAGHTLVVNVIVVFEIFYLFSVRYVHGTSLTLHGMVGTPPVLIGVITITLAQFAVTYVPFFNQVFGTRPVAFWDGVMVVCAGILFLFILEIEKYVRKWLR